MHDSPVGTIYLLKRTELAVRTCVEVTLAEFDLTPTQFLTLFRVRDANELSAAALARELGVRPQSMNEIIAPLERKKLLKREASREHQRILHMRLTSAGARLLADALQAAARLEAELLVDAEPAQIKVLQDVLTKLWTAAAERSRAGKEARSAAVYVDRGPIDSN
jgi:DNA-binding MarR family transcriptional regulator